MTHSRSRIEVTGPLQPRFDEILTPEALNFVARLHDAFAGRRQERLSARMEQRRAIDNGRDLHFLPETRAVRDDESWSVAPIAPGLEDRRVEITGPTDRESAVAALTSGAPVWLADLEDSTSPTWSAIIGGQVTLADAIRSQREYDGTATIVLRPRGWHLVEKHLRFTDASGISQAASASLVDFGLYFFHNATALIARGRGPYFYLPKIENHLEARLWDDVFTFAENAIGLEHGTVRATVLIETISAAFEMEEILYELRDHAAGLNAGRWDYLFSIIKNFRGRGSTFVLPDRGAITMRVPFMRAFTELLVRTCHKRGAYAIGSLSAEVAPSDSVALDKRREAYDGFDGTWVASPELVATARAEFDAVLRSKPNQLDRLRTDVTVSASDLLALDIDHAVTDAGVRANVSIGLRYLEAWLGGTGHVEIDGFIEDASTAEISRSQLWQWIDRRVVTVEGTAVTRAAIERLVAATVAEFGTPGGCWNEAAEVFREVVLGEDFPTFLTVAAYTRYLVERPELEAAA